MIGVLVITHGPLAEELLRAAERINEPRLGLRALSLDWSAGLEASTKRIREEIARLDTGKGVLLLTDMYGDTPSNAARACCEPGKVEMISGVNLPMVVRVSCALDEHSTLAAVAEALEAKGRQSIHRWTGAEEGNGGEGPNGFGRPGG